MFSKESLAKSVSKCFPSELSEWPLEFLAAGQEGTREKSMVVTSIRLLFHSNELGETRTPVWWCSSTKRFESEKHVSVP